MVINGVQKAIVLWDLEKARRALLLLNSFVEPIIIIICTRKFLAKKNVSMTTYLQKHIQQIKF